METFECSVAQEGYFAGPVFVMPSGEDEAPVAGVDQQGGRDAQTELSALRAAASSLRRSLCADKAGQASEGDAGIRQTVLAILDDEAFIGRAEALVREGGLSARAALGRTADELARSFDQLDSEYLRGRADDVRGVAGRLVAILDGGQVSVPREPCALCASQISPAQLVSLDEGLIGGLLSEKGSSNSHAAILAGNLGVPYLYGNAAALAAACRASFVIIDSQTACVTVDPDGPTRRAALERMEQMRLGHAVRASGVGAPSQADLPRCRTRVCANIAGPKDIEALLASGADGVGLFRTEFLFIGRDAAPGEEEQYEAYRAVLEAMAGREVIIRTMDVGSDKKAPWLELPEESNPALGLRGVRVSLEREGLFRTQLRALLRAATAGNLKVMFPMIASAWELDDIKARVQAVAQELEREGVPHKVPELGIMVETPAAALCADELAQKVAFFSVGTNDLTQYTLALDREARGLERYFDAHHEAVFKLIEKAVAAGRAHGVWTGVCGQLGADPEALPRLIRAGVDEVSVPIAKVGATKRLAAQLEAELAGAPAAGGALLPDGGGDPCGRAAQAQAAHAPAELSAPADGRLVAMLDIPDATFADATLGPCFAVAPENGRVYAPVAGVVVDVAQTGHAVTIAADGGGNVLVHVGIDTVRLAGKPFDVRVAPGDRVERDQLLMEADLGMIREAGLSDLVIVVALR